MSTTQHIFIAQFNQLCDVTALFSKQSIQIGVEKKKQSYKQSVKDPQRLGRACYPRGKVYLKVMDNCLHQLDYPGLVLERNKHNL